MKTHETLSFKWKLPGNDVEELQLEMKFKETHALFTRCGLLKLFEIELDPWNMLTWGENVIRREIVLENLNELPQLNDGLCNLHNLKRVKFAWKYYDGVHGVAKQAKWLVGIWRLPPRHSMSDVAPIEAKVHLTDDTCIEYIH